MHYFLCFQATIIEIKVTPLVFIGNGILPFVASWSCSKEILR